MLVGQPCNESIRCPSQSTPTETSPSDGRMLGRLKRHLLSRLRVQQRRVLELIATASTMDEIVLDLEKLQRTMRCLTDDIRKVDTASRRISGSWTPSPAPRCAGAPVGGHAPQTPPTPSPEAVKPSQLSMKTKRSTVSRRAAGDPLTPRVLDLGSPDVLGGHASPPLQRLAGSTRLDDSSVATSKPSTPNRREARPGVDRLLAKIFGAVDADTLADAALYGVKGQRTAAQCLPHDAPPLCISSPLEADVAAAAAVGAADAETLVTELRIAELCSPHDAPPLCISSSLEVGAAVAAAVGAADAETLVTELRIAELCSPHDTPPVCISSPLEVDVAAVEVGAAAVNAMDADTLAHIALCEVTEQRTAEQCSPHDVAHHYTSTPLEAAAAAVRSAVAATVAARTSSLGPLAAGQSVLKIARGVHAASKGSMQPACDTTSDEAQPSVLKAGSSASACPVVRGEAPIVPVGDLVLSRGRRQEQRSLARMHSTPPPNHYKLDRSYNLALSKLTAQPAVP
jgi:hypothetical protein